MATVKVYDRADEFRIDIAGRFAGECVEDIGRAWKNALLEAGPRRFTTDISRLSGYDLGGRKLLQEMYHHGMQFAAGTALSLVFLNEISAPPRRGPALTREARSNRQENQANAAFVPGIAAGQ